MEENNKDIATKRAEIVPHNKQSLPQTNTKFTKGVEGGESVTISHDGRISNVLTGNMILTKRSLEKKFDNGQTYEELLPKGATDREGNIIKLSAMQNRVIIALSNQIFSKNRKEVNQYLEALKENPNSQPSLPRIYVLLSYMSEDIFGEERRKQAIALSELNETISNDLITLSDMSGDIFGEEEKGKQSKIKDLYSELESIAKIKIPQVYPVGSFEDENGEHKVSFRALTPYITITGYEKQILIDDKIYSAIEIEPSRIFYERNWVGKGSRYFTLGKDVLGARLPSGRKITTEVYWCGLFPLAADYSWYYRHTRLPAAKKQIKDDNIIDSVKKDQLKEDALTCPPIPFQRIKEAINFQSKHPQEEARFIKQLWEGLWALVDRGIITEKSSIDWDKETFTLVFKENVDPLKRKPRGEWAEFSPKRKRGRRKADPNKREKQHPEQRDLFTEKV